jgi:hypothetical protein
MHLAVPIRIKQKSDSRGAVVVAQPRNVRVIAKKRDRIQTKAATRL